MGNQPDQKTLVVLPPSALPSLDAVKARMAAMRPNWPNECFAIGGADLAYEAMCALLPQIDYSKPAWPTQDTPENIAAKNATPYKSPQAKRTARAALPREQVADADTKAVYVETFGSDKGWLGIEGSYFIEGYRAGKSAPAGVQLVDAPSSDDRAVFEKLGREMYAMTTTVHSPNIPFAEACACIPDVWESLVQERDRLRTAGLELPREPSDEQVRAALRAACLHDTSESRKDMRSALLAASGVLPGRLVREGDALPDGDQVSAAAHLRAGREQIGAAIGELEVAESSLAVAGMAREVFGNPIPREAYAFAELLQKANAERTAGVRAAVDRLLKAIDDLAPPSPESDGDADHSTVHRAERG